MSAPSTADISTMACLGLGCLLAGLAVLAAVLFSEVQYWKSVAQALKGKVRDLTDQNEKLERDVRGLSAALHAERSQDSAKNFQSRINPLLREGATLEEIRERAEWRTR